MMDSLLSPAFNVDLSDVSKPLDNPKSGEDYLKNVVFERQTFYPETIIAPVNIEKLNNKQNIFIEQLPTRISSSESILPTVEWQTMQEADFSDVRCKFSALYNSKDVWSHHIEYPPITDNSSELWTKFMSTNLPQLSLVFTMNQTVLEYMLDILIDTLDDIQQGDGLSRHCGLWLYAVLVSLKLPLTPDVCSSLRNLARKCQLIRSKLNLQREDIEQVVSPLNLFICLIARYFRQGDFAD